MTEALPEPVFVHYGFDKGASCSSFVTIDDQTFLAVGSSSGQCAVYSTTTHLRIARIYEDSEGRSVVGVGQICDAVLFVHVRAYAVLCFRLHVYEKEHMKFQLEHRYLTDHYGFCRATSLEGHLFIPMHKDEKSTLKVVENENEWIVNVVIEEKKRNATLMHVCISREGYAVCCFEDGAVNIVDWSLGKSSVLCSEKVFPEAALTSATYESLIAVSSVKSPIKLFLIQSSKFTEKREINFPFGVGGCASLCFSPCGKFLASGYWDGSVRVHSVKSRAVKVVLSFHSNTINFLNWAPVDGKRFLCASSKDHSVTIWNLQNDR